MWCSPNWNLAAFIVSKLITESEKEGNISNKLDNLLVEYNDLRRRINSRYFNWHDEMIIRYSQDLVDSIKNGDFNNLNNEKKLLKLFEIDKNLFGTETCLDFLNEQITELRNFCT